MKKKISISILILIVIVAFSVYNYIYKDHRNIETEAATFVLSAHELSNDFITDVKNAETKYLNKTIELRGSITEVVQNSITIDDKAFCQFEGQLETITAHEIVKIKGRVIGYDDLLEQVKLDQCHIIN